MAEMNRVKWSQARSGSQAVGSEPKRTKSVVEKTRSSDLGKPSAAERKTLIIAFQMCFLTSGGIRMGERKQEERLDRCS